MIDATNIGGFAAQDLQGTETWFKRTQAEISFPTQFPSLTTVGTAIYTLRYRRLGKSCQGQMQFSAGTSVASVAGTDYFVLPITPMGVAGFGAMGDNNTNIAVGLCHLDLVNGRCYLPTQAASAHVFTVWFEYEVA